MAMSHGHSSHHRRTPSGPKSPKSRSTRPSIHRRGTSSANISISKLGSGHSRSVAVEDDDLLPEMASSFLNYCAMCEKQITVPDSRLLYCSESCRRKDSHKPLSASLPSSTTIPPSFTPPTSPMSCPTYIVAPLTPTKAPITIPSRIPTDTVEAKTDLDPTEWKPVISSEASEALSPSIMTSDAWKYLARFHSDDSVPALRRMKGHAHSQSSTSVSTLPSLSRTLSSSSSSSASSVSSSAQSYVGHVYGSHRPLPPRHRTCFSGRSSISKGVELITPQITVVPDTSVDAPNSGSIFPAGSRLWDEKSQAKATPVITVSEATK
ncbi:uncharacterized protein BDV17DRAFT_127015 [Aspergillus undulatus]|uniref:uncharacterized protein n=1 Tax=Aspergillus undulatus TaxID=1810928 RepID=UPI003CCCF80A